MEALSIILSVICSLVIGYLFGSISNGVIIGKLFFHIDVRTLGSHNAGGTNTGRVLGKKIGLITIILDMLKTMIAMWIVLLIARIPAVNQLLYLNPSYLVYIAGVGACLGHTFPVFFQFRGGKAVACMFGILFATNYLFALIGIAAFALFFFTTKYVSVGSMAAGVVVAGISFIPNFSQMFMNFAMVGDIYYSLLLIFVALYVILRHHQNIARLINGTENKAKWLMKKTPSTDSNSSSENEKEEK